MTLKHFEIKWLDFLRSEACPPVLGLAPMPESEIQEISAAVRRSVPNQTATLRLQHILDFLRFYPAAMAIWLTGKASDAYDFGAFWRNFEQKVGVTIPILRREELAEEFRRACRRVMLNHIEPRRQVAHVHLEPFLFQAGLPLCHCSRFAELVRTVEQQYGLPDPDSPESGEDLRDHILAVGTYALVPVLRRALEGGAGALICRTAASVVTNGQYRDINPMLGKALQVAFSRQEGTAVNRAARLPYLRLRSDQAGFEIVGPRQETSLIGTDQLTWVMNGISHRASTYEEFVYPVAGESRVSVELRGLRQGLSATRTFVLRLEDREQPFMLFATGTRRAIRDQHGNAMWLPCGRYWLWRPRSSEVTPAPEFDYPIGDEQGLLSEITVAPNSRSRLTLPDGREWLFEPELAPFISYPGQSLLTDSGDEIHFGWECMPDVWRPAAPEAVASREWKLRAVLSGTEHDLELPVGRIEGTMEVSRPTDETLLQILEPGLHRLEFSILHGNRRVLRSECLLWIGLVSHTKGRAFRLSRFPTNLLHSRCAGFEISPDLITHHQDGLRQHFLAFRLNGEAMTLPWSRQGIFLEAYQKVSGKPAIFVPHALGSALSGALDCSTWIRIWIIPAEDVDVILNGDAVHGMKAGAGRSFVDLSLSQLLAVNHRGGMIRLRFNDFERDVVELTQALVPTYVASSCSGRDRLLRLEFAERLGNIRVHAENIISSEVIEFPDLTPEQLTAGPLEMIQPVSVIIACEEAPLGTPRHTLNIRVPAAGWPQGFWIMSVHAAREGSSGLQPITDADGRQIGLLTIGDGEGTDPQAEILSLAYSGSPTIATEASLNADDRHDLLYKLFKIHRRRFAPEVAGDFAWLQTLLLSIVQRVDSTLGDATSDEIGRLLTLASTAEESDAENWGESRSLFVTMPRLTAIKARRYSEVPPITPLTRALRWCARMTAQECAMDVFLPALMQTFQSGRESEVVRFLHGYRNFAAVVSQNPDAEERKDFHSFDFEYFRTQIVGRIYSPEPHAEYDDFSLFGRSHFEWALSRFDDHRASRLGNFDFGRVNALLSSASRFRDWLMHRIDPETALLAAPTWVHPWPIVSLENDSFMENCVQFASLYALAARACGDARLEFCEVVDWLTTHTPNQSMAEQAIVAMVEMAPELLGYYLMLWELILRTGPHGRT